MPKMEVTPTDELTGLPLPLVPLDDFGPEPNWHHHFHPKKDPALTKGAGGYAVRQCRIQRYAFDLHTGEYHAHFSGPPLPRTIEEKFVTTVMAVAGYMPHEAIDMRGGRPQIVPLSHDQKRRLQTSGEIKIGAEALIRRFMKDYVLNNGIDAIDASGLAVEEFIVTTDEARRRELGHNLLGLVIDKAAEPADEIYYQAKKKELLKPNLAGNVQRFIKSKLGSKRNRERIIDDLYEHLAPA